MSQPKALGLKMPANGDPQKLGKSSAMTVLALDNDRVFYYFGDLSDKISGITDYKLNGGIGDIIRAKQKEMDQTVKGGRNELMLLIKPTSASNYRNVVQLLDETAINDIKKYALVDPDTAEEAEAKKSLNP